MNTDDIAKAFQDLENLPAFPSVIIHRYETWKEGWNIAFPNLAFSEKELRAGLSHEQGFLGWRIGIKCFISKPIDFRKERGMQTEKEYRELMYRIGLGREYEEIQAKKRQMVNDLSHKELVALVNGGNRHYLVMHKFQEIFGF